MTRFEWEPAYGWCATGVTSNEDLASALESVRRQVCQYGSQGDQTCDCKYGATADEDSAGNSERSGCPELRELIHRLLHLPGTLAVVD